MGRVEGCNGGEDDQTFIDVARSDQIDLCPPYSLVNQKTPSFFLAIL